MANKSYEMRQPVNTLLRATETNERYIQEEIKGRTESGKGCYLIVQHVLATYKPYRLKYVYTTVM